MRDWVKTPAAAAAGNKSYGKKKIKKKKKELLLYNGRGHLVCAPPKPK